ncbi:MAG: phosphatidylserine/phosphatidylglycerophosphate/cardiolipin synthase family protein [Longimicrobiales bacterium]
MTDPGVLDARGPLDPTVQERLRAISASRVTAGNRVRLLVDGVQTYTTMLDLVEQAEREILFENFIFRADAVGIAFADALRGRAETGVDVRVLHDPFGSLMSLRAPIGFRFHRSPVRVRVYNPPRPTPAFFRRGRDHRKLVVQDRRRLVVGGMCLADVWLGNCVSMCTWRDSAALVEGEAAQEAARAFEHLWGHGRTFTPRRPSPTARPAGEPSLQPSGSVPVRLVADEPRKRRVERMLAEVFGAATSEILITNPYVILPESLTKALTAAARRGVATHLLVPRSGNHHWVGLSSEHRIGRLLAAGVKVWRWRGPLIHAKTIVVDRRWSMVGSTNLDPLSLWRNAEINAEIHGSRLGEQMADLFFRDVRSATHFSHDDWLHRPRFRRLLTQAATFGWSWQ